LNKRKYRSIACALALATSFATINFSPVYAEEEGSNETENITESVATDTSTAETENAAAPATPATVAVGNEKLQAWRNSRPQETSIKDVLKTVEGQTVVSVEAADTSIPAQAMSVVKLKPGDVFTEAAMAQDRQAIYETGLFYDIYPSIEIIPEGIKLTYHVMENPVLKSVEIIGNQALTTDTIKGLLTVHTGELLNSKILNENIKAIEEAYRKEGYILAKISNIAINDQGELKLTFNEGVLEGYSVKGNEKTKDKVILREMRMKPGEPFNVKKARRSMQRIYNLGFFEDVNMKLNPGREPNAIVLETTVVEKKTGTFGVGAGYSNSDGFMGMIQLGDKNFRGMGDAINISYEFSGDEQDNKGIVFSYTRPWLDSKETTGTIRVYNRTYEYDDYDTEGDHIETYRKKYRGAELTLGRPVSEYSTNYITLRNREDIYINHVDDEGGYLNRSGTDYDQWRDDNFGLTRSLTLQHVTDTRDNIYNPTSGEKISLTTEFAGFGGDFDYQKYTIEDKRYIKVGHAQVVALRGQYGHGEGHIPESNQYQLGGQDNLRGYRNEQFEGDSMFMGTIEYRFPVVKKVQGALFTDFGSAWDDGWGPKGFHKSIGVGLQMETPVGPIRIDYGRGEDGARTHFSIGSTF
jgi:outer membrane protein insertion porin family